MTHQVGLVGRVVLLGAHANQTVIVQENAKRVTGSNQDVDAQVKFVALHQEGLVQVLLNNKVLVGWQLLTATDKRDPGSREALLILGGENYGGIIKDGMVKIIKKMIDGSIVETMNKTDDTGTVFYSYWSQKIGANKILILGVSLQYFIWKPSESVEGNISDLLPLPILVVLSCLYVPRLTLACCVFCSVNG